MCTNFFILMGSPVHSAYGVRFGGCRSFRTVMACWLAGIWQWVSLQLHLNTVRGPSMLMLTAFPGNVDSVCGRAVRCHLPTRVPTIRIPQRSCWISLLHPLKWGIPWTRTYCQNCPEKRGWQPPIWKNLRRIYRQPIRNRISSLHPGVRRP